MFQKFNKQKGNKFSFPTSSLNKAFFTSIFVLNHTEDDITITEFDKLPKYRRIKSKLIRNHNWKMVWPVPHPCVGQEYSCVHCEGSLKTVRASVKYYFGGTFTSTPGIHIPRV